MRAQARELMPRWYCLKRLGSSFSSRLAEASPDSASWMIIVSRNSSSTFENPTILKISAQKEARWISEAFTGNHALCHWWQ